MEFLSFFLIEGSQSFFLPYKIQSAGSGEEIPTLSICLDGFALRVSFGFFCNLACVSFVYGLALRCRTFLNVSSSSQNGWQNTNIKTLNDVNTKTPNGEVTNDKIINDEITSEWKE